MRSLMQSIPLFCLLFCAATVLAQPRAVRRPGAPPIPPQNPHNNMAPPPPSNAQMCTQKRTILAQDQDRLDDMRTQMTGIDSELAQLKRRMDDLSRQKTAVRSQVNYYEQRVRKASDEYRRDCAKDESCQQYETLTTQLDQQGNNVQAQLTNVRNQIETYRREIGNLDAQIQPLRTEYTNLQCNNMIPGATAQATIDRCSWIFSEWNRLQTQLNAMNNNLPMLKTQYEQLLAQLKGIEARARDYDVYMSRNCTASTQYKTVQNYGKGNVRQNAETMGGELDQLIKDVARLKGVQISVTAK